MTSTTEKEALAQVHLKATRPRLAILALFKHSETKHLSAEAVHELLSAGQVRVGIATIYRALVKFEASGILKRSLIDQGRAVLFELDTSDHHGHLVCSKCGKTEEFFDKRIENWQRAIARDRRFILEGHRVTLYGCCPDCAGKK